MRVYNIFSGAAFSLLAADRTLLSVMAAAERTFKLKKLLITSTDTAGATVREIIISRATAGGTGTAATATPMSQGGPGFGGVDLYDLTVDATTGVEIMRLHWNIQVPLELVFPPGEELIVPGAANEGFAVDVAVDVSALVFHINALIEEL